MEMPQGAAVPQSPPSAAALESSTATLAHSRSSSTPQPLELSSAPAHDDSSALSPSSAAHPVSSTSAKSVPSPAVPQSALVAPPHPKPRPAVIPSTGNKRPDPFAELGRTRPWTPSDIFTPSGASVASTTASSASVALTTTAMTSIHDPTAISTPVPSSLAALKARAAMESEAKAVAAMQASIDLRHQQATLVYPPVVANTAPSSTIEPSTVKPVLASVASSPPAPPKSASSSIVDATPPGNEPAFSTTRTGRTRTLTAG